MSSKVGAVLVVGGGVSGIQSALDLADSGYKVYLVDKDPSIGGVMAQLDKTFPTNDCSMCILAPKLVAAGGHQNIELITNSEVTEVSGEAGNFKVKVLSHARSIDEEKCTGCGVCTEVCPVRFEIDPTDKPEQAPECRDTVLIDEFIQKNTNYQDPLIQILLDVNGQYRYLPRDVIEYVSYSLDIPMAQVYRVATFYKAFSLVPVGKYHFKVCQGTSCHVRGSREIMDAVTEKIEGEPKGVFSIQTVNCLGACAMGPVIMCNDDYHGNMTRKKVHQIVDDIKANDTEFIAQQRAREEEGDDE